MKNEGLWVTKVCQGLLATRGLYRLWGGGVWVKVDKNVGLSVNMVKAGLKKYRVFLVAHGV